MNEKIMSKQYKSKFKRRSILGALLAGGASLPLYANNPTSRDYVNTDAESNSLLWAVAWKETSAEYGALCHQAFNLARLKVDQELNRKSKSKKPLAIITDMDNTIIHATSYWGHIINQNKEFFDDSIWDEWVPKNLIKAIPVSKRFFDYCYDNDVEVFYVTNRDQGAKTFDYALSQLNYLDLPFADKEHLTVYRESSNKMPTKNQINQSHKLILMLGDNLNDYKRDYYIKNVSQRYEVMERDKDEYGDKFILIPNPTDGHWVRAMFGTSEPEPSQENLMLLKEYATRSAWDGE